MVKTFIAALFLVSGSLFAYELDATEALLETLPAGEYRGLTPKGINCEVSVVDLSDKVIVTASSENVIRTSEVTPGALYRWNPASRSFLASRIARTMSASRENILRTIAVTEKTQYVVVSDLIITDRETIENKVECVVEL